MSDLLKLRNAVTTARSLLGDAYGPTIGPAMRELDTARSIAERLLAEECSAKSQEQFKAQRDEAIERMKG